MPNAPTRRLPRPQRRAQLLNAAKESFVANGYHNTAMDDIALRAGVSKPVLYQHFTSKYDLYLALVDAQAADLVQRLRQALASSSDNETQTRATIAAYFEFYEGSDGSHRLLFESDVSHEPEVRERLDALAAACIDPVSDTFQSETGLNRTYADLVAASIVGLAQICAQRWYDDGRLVPRDEAAELIARIAWRGLDRVPLSEMGQEQQRQAAAAKSAP